MILTERCFSLRMKWAKRVHLRRLSETRFPRLNLDINSSELRTGEHLSTCSLNDLFVPRTWSGCNDQISEFLLWKFGVVLVYITRDCSLAAHSSVHASFILRRGLTRFQLPKGFLDLRIIKCRNSSEKLEWGPCALDRKHLTHCSQSIVSLDCIPPGTYSWQP